MEGLSKIRCHRRWESKTYELQIANRQKFRNSIFSAILNCNASRFSLYMISGAAHLMQSYNRASLTFIRSCDRDLRDNDDDELFLPHLAALFLQLPRAHFSLRQHSSTPFRSRSSYLFVVTVFRCSILGTLSSFQVLSIFPIPSREHSSSRGKR